MLSSDVLNVATNVFLGISIVIALVPIIGILLLRYSKNHRLTALYYTCILCIAPWYATAYGHRGLARLWLKEPDKAMRDCNRAIKLNSDLYWVYNNRGILHMQAKRYKEALIEFDRSIKLKLDYQLPYTNSIRVNIKLKNYEQALANIEAYIAIKGKVQEASIYCNRGTIYVFLKEYGRAVQDFDRSLELDPNYALSYHNRGCTYLRMNDIKQRYASIIYACILKPKFILYNWTNEWCKMCIEQPNDATIERLETLAKLEPEHNIAHTSRGVALWLRGDFAAAAKELEQAIALEPDAEDAYFWAGMTYASQGHDEEALVALRQAQTMGVRDLRITYTGSSALLMKNICSPS